MTTLFILLTLLTILKLPTVLMSLAILISLTPLLTLLTCTIQPLLTLPVLADIQKQGYPAGRSLVRRR